MATASNTTNSFNKIQEASMLNQPESEKRAAEQAQALILSLSQTLEELLKDTAQESGAHSSKIVHPNFGNSSKAQSSSSSQSQAPSSESMQEEMGYLMGQLAGLQASIATNTNQKLNINYTVSQSLVTQMQDRLNDANEQVTKIGQAQNESATMSTFQKSMMGIMGALVAAVGFASGGLALPLVVLAMTFLEVAPVCANGTTVMDQATSGFSTLLQNMGCSKETADIVANVTILAASIAINMAALYFSAPGELVAGSNLAKLVKAIQVVMIVGGVLQAGGQITEGCIQADLADFTKKLGNANACLSLLQGLLNMNTVALKEVIKTQKTQMQEQSKGISTLGTDWVKEGEEVTKVLGA